MYASYLQNVSIKPTLQIRNVTQDIYDRLRFIAKSNRRSLNQEAIHQLEVSLMKKTRVERRKLKLATQKRVSNMNLPEVDPNEIVKWMREDRDSTQYEYSLPYIAINILRP